MCIFGKKLRQRIKELEVENELLRNLRDNNIEIISRLRAELYKRPARGADGRFTKRKA